MKRKLHPLPLRYNWLQQPLQLEYMLSSLQNKRKIKREVRRVDSFAVRGEVEPIIKTLKKRGLF
jgi:hypothetical protein